MAETTRSPVSTESIVTGNRHTVEGRRGPNWRGWAISILVAVILSVAATLLLGGSAGFRSDRAVAMGAGGTGSGNICCPPGDAGK